MKSLVLITFETPVVPADERISAVIGEEFDRRRRNGAAQVCIDRVCVSVGGAHSQPDNTGEIIRWSLGPTVPAQNALQTDARTLATYLNFRLHQRNDVADCNIIFAANSPEACSAALTVGAYVVAAMQQHRPVHAQMALCQSQLVINDAPTHQLFQDIHTYNQNKQYVYDNLYLLPWDNEEAQEETLSTLRAIAVAGTLPGSGAVVLGTQNSDPDMIRTAAVFELRAPVRQISDLIYSQLSEWLDQVTFQVQPQNADGNSFAGNSAIGRGADAIVRMLEDFERGYRLPELSELYMIMPLHDADPADIPSEKEGLTAAAAWKYINKIYGEKVAADIRERLQKDPQTLQRYYESTCRSVAQKIVEFALETARSGRVDIQVLPMVIERIVSRATSKLNSREEPEEKPIRYGKALFGEKRRVIASAQARHRCLSAVYAEAKAQAGKEKSGVSAALLTDAGRIADNFLKDSLAQLGKSFAVAAQRHASSSESGAVYLEGLAAAYKNYWCSQNIPSQDRFDLDTIYALYDPEIYGPLFENGVTEEEARAYAERLAAELEAKIESRVEALMSGIRSRIDGFFAELSFRDELLQKQNNQLNLTAGMVLFLEKRLARKPLMKTVQPGDDSLPPVDKVFIVRSTSEIDGFRSQINKIGNVSILQDINAEGEQLLTKYVGPALSMLTVYINN